MDKPSADGSLPTNKPGHRDKTGGSGRGSLRYAPAPARFRRSASVQRPGVLRRAMKDTRLGVASHYRPHKCLKGDGRSGTNPPCSRSLN